MNAAWRRVTATALLAAGLGAAPAAEPGLGPDRLREPLSIADCRRLALEQNGTLLRAREDLASTAGVVLQNRSAALPTLRATSDYETMDGGLVESFGDFPRNKETWVNELRLEQSLYEGGRVRSSLRAARLLEEKAPFDYESTVADVLLGVQVAYYDVLLSALQIRVQEASVKLLSEQWNDSRLRFEAGTVPQFNVLRAEVELANVRPLLIVAQNRHRLAKQQLANLLGFHMVESLMEDLPMELTDSLETPAPEVNPATAVDQALTNRTEVAALERLVLLRGEALTAERSGYQPRVQAFGSYGSRNRSFAEGLDQDLSGWTAGLQLNWDLFDGRLTRGRVLEAEALYRKAQVELDDLKREIEFEVRRAYSDFIDAGDVLASQEKTVNLAEEALRQVIGRNKAGTSTQLDVLSSQTALTEARTVLARAQRDYAVAIARLKRAMGEVPRVE